MRFNFWPKTLSRLSTFAKRAKPRVIIKCKGVSSNCTQVTRALFLQEFGESCNDVTTSLPKGASSIVVARDTEDWQVFTEVSFRGATVILQPGKKYKSPNEMGLQESVKSFRKAP